jgi:hypothetical protein
MLQSVNLYLPEFRQKRHWLDAVRMLQLVVATVLVLVLASGWDYWQLSQARAGLAVREQQRQAALAATAALRAEYGDQSADLSLQETIERFEQDLRAKETLLQFLQGSDLGNAEGFSEYLADLSRFHLQGLSLQSIQLADGGRSVVLGGQVLQTELVPLYLQNLNKGGSFSGKNFETLNIRDETTGAGVAAAAPIWSFEVRSGQQ